MQETVPLNREVEQLGIKLHEVKQHRSLQRSLMYIIQKTILKMRTAPNFKTRRCDSPPQMTLIKEFYFF